MHVTSGFLALTSDLRYLITLSARNSTVWGYVQTDLFVTTHESAPHTDLTWYTNTSIFGGVDKPLIWLGSSRRELRAFPDAARQVAGFQLRRVQQGLEPNDWKPMTTVGVGVAEGVYVLHAFEKRTRKTPKRDTDLARERLRALIEQRRGDKAAGR